MRSFLAIFVLIGGLYGVGFLTTANASNDLTKMMIENQQKQEAELRSAGFIK